MKIVNHQKIVVLIMQRTGKCDMIFKLTIFFPVAYTFRYFRAFVGLIVGLIDSLILGLQSSLTIILDFPDSFFCVACKHVILLVFTVLDLDPFFILFWVSMLLTNLELHSIFHSKFLVKQEFEYKI